jgi:hypothetical protein
VLVVDGRGPFGAIGRSITLSCRAGLRAARIRLVGYLGWLTIRAALGFGGVAVLGMVLPLDGTWATVIGFVIWTAVNTVSYATLASLDAVLHLETRMRTEGLDIVAVRAGRHGQPVTLAVPR